MFIFIMRLKYHMLHILRISNPNVGVNELADAFGRYMYNVQSERFWPILLREIKRQKKKGLDFNELAALTFCILSNTNIFEYRDRLDSPIQVWINNALLEYGTGGVQFPDFAFEAS